MRVQKTLIIIFLIIFASFTYLNLNGCGTSDGVSDVPAIAASPSSTETAESDSGSSGGGNEAGEYSCTDTNATVTETFTGTNGNLFLSANRSADPTPCPFSSQCNDANGKWNGVYDGDGATNAQAKFLNNQLTFSPSNLDSTHGTGAHWFMLASPAAFSNENVHVSLELSSVPAQVGNIALYGKVSSYPIDTGYAAGLKYIGGNVLFYITEKYSANVSSCVGVDGTDYVLIPGTVGIYFHYMTINQALVDNASARLNFIITDAASNNLKTYITDSNGDVINACSGSAAAGGGVSPCSILCTDSTYNSGTAGFLTQNDTITPGSVTVDSFRLCSGTSVNTD